MDDMFSRRDALKSMFYAGVGIASCGTLMQSLSTPALAASGLSSLGAQMFDDEGCDLIILQQGKSFASQINVEKAIYIIRYAFSLYGKTVNIPSDCVLRFEGGCLNSGVIVGNKARIEACPTRIFGTDVTISGSWIANEVYPEWFGAKGDGKSDDSKAFESINQLVKDDNYSPKLGDIVLSNTAYVLKDTVRLNYNIKGCAGTRIIFDGGCFKYYYPRGIDDCIAISYVKFSATDKSPRLFDVNPNHYVFYKCVFENCYDIMHQLSGKDVWTGNINFNDCIFRDITNVAVDAAIFMNRVCFNGCIFRRVNYILSAYIYCGVSFISCDIERVHLFNRMSKAWGVSFSGCYIESNYTDNKEDAFIVINSPFTGCVDFYNCFIQATRYVVFEKDDISMDFSIPRGVIKFTDCALLGHTSFDLFWLGNKHCVFVELNGPKAIIGKWNEKYSNITQFASLSDIVNRPNCVINNVQAYQYMQGKFVNSRLVPSSGSTSQRPKGIGAKNSEGVIDTTFGVGFVYFDTTLGKPIYVKEVSGNGTITWVDAAGQKV